VQGSDWPYGATLPAAVAAGSAGGNIAPYVRDRGCWSTRRSD